MPKKKILMDDNIIQIFREFGKQGAKKSLQVQTKAQRSAAGKLGAMKRWGKKATSPGVRRGKKS